MNTEEVAKCIRKYHSLAKRLRDCESRFDSFVRANRYNDSARREYAAKANAEYFDIKSQMAAVRSDYYLKARPIPCVKLSA